MYAKRCCAKYSGNNCQLPKPQLMDDDQNVFIWIANDSYSNWPDSQSSASSRKLYVNLSRPGLTLTQAPVFLYTPHHLLNIDSFTATLMIKQYTIVACRNSILFVIILFTSRVAWLSRLLLVAVS